jgi:DHA2 family multidrug resistance protein
MMATSDVFWGISIVFLLLIGLLWLTKPPFGAAMAGGGH